MYKNLYECMFICIAMYTRICMSKKIYLCVSICMYEYAPSKINSFEISKSSKFCLASSSLVLGGMMYILGTVSKLKLENTFLALSTSEKTNSSQQRERDKDVKMDERKKEKKKERDSEVKRSKAKQSKAKQSQVK